MKLLKRPSAKKDIAAEQTLVRDMWQLVNSNIQIDQAMCAFVTQGLDVCGQTIAVSAFELVRKVLNLKGFVRRHHKSEAQYLGELVRAKESAWKQEGNVIHRRWDFMGAWQNNVKLWRELNDNCHPLLIRTVMKFCELDLNITVLSREDHALYTDLHDENTDRLYSVQVLDVNGHRIPFLDSLFDEESPANGCITMGV